MTDAATKAAIQKYLKTVSYNAQRELEKAIGSAMAAGKLNAGDVLTTGITIANDRIDMDITIYSKIEL